MDFEWDCVVIGGGAAGLSAGLVLGRAQRPTLLLDLGGQSNRPAEGIGGLLGNDRRSPAEFYAVGREELAAYGSVELRDAEAVGGEPRAGGFALELGGGEEILTRNVLLATGMDYRYPELPGAGELWGRSVFHCPSVTAGRCGGRTWRSSAATRWRSTGPCYCEAGATA